jgi:hypothetical protein
VTHTQSPKYTQNNTPSVLQREFPHSLTRAHLSFESLSLHSLEEALFFIQEALSSSCVGMICKAWRHSFYIRNSHRYHGIFEYEMGSSNTKDSRLGGEDENGLLVLALGNFLYRKKNVLQGKIK